MKILVERETIQFCIIRLDPESTKILGNLLDRVETLDGIEGHREDVLIEELVPFLKEDS